MSFREYDGAARLRDRARVWNIIDPGLDYDIGTTWQTWAAGSG